ncbi:hypothetical protein LPY66_10945 [Dehalobacter sp. DCM]|uniref:putative ABC transporter permease subunit n=1 Tax=Dehalobacter sp. DCM TaxID=2907827 RepID=UPI003081B9CC|nr:hypothetical protein LPY66_10945 [Dehalobacter sp. DCM]
MRLILPPPLKTPLREQSMLKDFRLLLGSQLRVYRNKLKHTPKRTLIGMAVMTLFIVLFFLSFAFMAKNFLENIPYDMVQGFLSLVFMIGIATQMFFGIAAAFAALYMTDDLELLFMTPIPIKVIFIVKSLSVFVTNLLPVILFIFMPGVICGLTHNAGGFYYLLLLLSGLALWIIGTALAMLVNLLVMSIVPPHRSKEAIGFIAAMSGVLIALIFQIPSLFLANQGSIEIGSWLNGQESLIHIMSFFPWGWGSLSLTHGLAGNIGGGIGWSLLMILLGVGMFQLALVLLDRGFRRGYIAVSQGEGPRRRKARHTTPTAYKENEQHPRTSLSMLEGTAAQTSSLVGMWAIAKKDLLAMKRDTREWFNILVPLIIMAFFILQFIYSPNPNGSQYTVITVLIMYTIMFSGNLALQAFGKEAESEWLLNSVPLAGWPIVWGKLIAVVLPTLLLMEALLVGTSVAIGLSPGFIILLAFAAFLISMGSSAIGLFYSITNCRYNPDNPKMRISPGATMIMYLINLFFILLLAVSLCYFFPPAELVLLIQGLPTPTLHAQIGSVIGYVLYFLSRPVLWPAVWRIVLGILLTVGIWSLIFFSFMAATVRQSRKGFHVQIVTSQKRNIKL